MDVRFETDLRDRAAYLRRLLVRITPGSAGQQPWPHADALRPDPFSPELQRILDEGAVVAARRAAEADAAAPRRRRRRVEDQSD